MAKEFNMANDNKILEIKTGSNLYGLALPTSDIDYSGVFMPNMEYVLGFKTCDEVDLSFKSKLDNGKNSKDAIDRKLYNFQKYVRLAMQNNPNVLEMLFVNEENIVFINDIGRRLLNNAHLFPHKGLEQRFVGYAVSQKKKMIIKRENFLELEKADEMINRLFNDGKGKMLLAQCHDEPEFLDIFRLKRLTDNDYKFGARGLPKNITVKRAKDRIADMIGTSTNRKDLIKEKGFDYKFGHHLIRLLVEGKELLETGKLIYPIQNKQELLDIKTGKWSLEDVLEYSEQLENEIRDLKITSCLPDKPQTEKIEKYMIDELERFLFGKGV